MALQKNNSLKDAAISFLRMIVAGKIREAYALYTIKDFRHHNPYCRGGAEGIITAMEENHAQCPNKIIEIQHAVQEGDIVAVHSRIRMKPGDPGMAVVHVFRFNGERIAELWDIGQVPPEISPNEHGMF